MKTWQLLISIIVFQFTWINAALLNENIALIGLVSLLVMLKFSLAGHLQILIAGTLAILLGVVMDGILHYSGIYEFPVSYTLFYLNVPIWLLIMWAAFATTLFSSLYWALNKPILFIGLCSIFGPVSYLVGREMGIIHFENHRSYILVGSWGLWSCLFSGLWHAVLKKINFSEL